MKKFNLLTLFSLLFVLILSVFVVQKFSDNRQRADELSSESLNTHNYLTIAGYVYVDENQNGERDLRERSYSNAILNITMSRTRPRNTPTFAPTIPATNSPQPTGVTPELNEEDIPLPPLYKTDNHGYFKYTLESSMVPERNYFRVTLNEPKGFVLTTKNPINFENLYKRTRKIVEFGIVREIKVPMPTCTPLPYECLYPTIEPDGSVLECLPPENGSWCPIPEPTCTPRPSCLDATPACQIPEPEDGWCPVSPTPQSCAQVITHARNRNTGQCRRFPSACLPEGWRADRSCTITPTVSITPIACATPPICLDDETLLTGDPAPGNGSCPAYYCLPVTE